MSSLTDTFEQGFLQQTYGQWFLFLLLFTFMWTAAVSLNTLVRREVRA